ncbi:MAG: glycosyltransferase [Proteobacteria bacterium]|nr:glycosyltransferase [Pseudomonadota bacterium]
MFSLHFSAYLKFTAKRKNAASRYWMYGKRNGAGFGQMNKQNIISVVVATRNRAASLARLLDGLVGQIGAPPFEVIIGDNGSSDDTPMVVERARDRLQVRYVHEERPGKSRTLNAALKLARGELIVFTDDDVLPQSDWLAQLHVAALRHTDANIFGGRIGVDMKSVPLWVARSFNLMGLLASCHDKGERNVRYGYREYPFGPNMAVRRHCIAGLNKPYPEYLGPGTKMPVGDEPTFLSQLSPPEANDRLFVASACVMHAVEAENVFFIKAIKRCYLAGLAHGMLGIFHMSQDRNSPTSTFSLITQRLGTCRSLREMICISARYLGYLQGHRVYSRKNSGNDG